MTGKGDESNFEIGLIPFSGGQVARGWNVRHTSSGLVMRFAVEAV